MTIVKNPTNITFDEINEFFASFSYDIDGRVPSSVNFPYNEMPDSNLPEQNIGYYAYNLQQRLPKPIKVPQVKTYSNNHMDVPLIKIVGEIKDIEISKKKFQRNTSDFLKEELAKQSTEENKKSYIDTFGQEEYDKYIDQLNKTIIHYDEAGIPYYELSMRVWLNGIGYPVIIRNGSIHFYMQFISVESFEDLVNFNAEVIYNPKPFNPGIVSFVRFVKKSEM